MLAEMTTSASLWRDKNFLQFFVGRVISNTGSAITMVTLPILAFQLTGNALKTSLLTALEVVPYLLFGLLAGAFADRVNRRAMMIVCDWINAALLLSVPVAGWLGVLTLTQLYVVALLSATAYVWFDAADFGLMTQLAGKARVPQANSLLFSTNTIIGIVAPALGGVCIALLGAANTLMLDSVSYAISAIVLLLLPRQFGQIAAPSQDANPQTSILKDIGEGLRFIWQHKLVRVLTLLGFGNSVTGGAVIGLVVVYAVRALGLANTDARVGWLYTTMAVGALAGSLVLGRITKHVPVGRITLWALLCSLVSLMAYAIAPNLWVALGCIAVWECAYYIIIVNGISIRQIVAPAHLQGRVNTTARMIAWGGTPFGATLGGALAEVLDVRLALLVMAFGVALSLAFGWFSDLRHQPKMSELKVDAG